MKVLVEKKTLVKLDKKDLRILKNLCENYRMPLSEIARNVALSRTSVENRVRNLHEKALVVGGRSVVNLRALGYSTYHVFIEALSRKSEAVLVERAIGNEGVNAIIAYSGRYILEVSIVARNPEEFLGIAEGLFGEFNINFGCSLIILKTLKSGILPDYFFKGLEFKQETMNKSSKKASEYRVDSKDIEIISMLAEDAGISAGSIASRLKMNKDTVAYRIKQLVGNKVLLQFRPAINYSAIGMTIHTLLLKTKSAPHSDVKNFEDGLKNRDDVLWAAKTFGEWQYIIYLILKENEELHSFIQNLMSEFGGMIDNYELLFAYREYKYSFFSKNVKV